MKGKLVLDEILRDKLHVFNNRQEAGTILAQKLIHYKYSDCLTLAIPSGGVPIASEIARALDLPLELILVRKIRIPWNSEASFGAVDADGNVFLNNALLTRIGWITEADISSQVKKTLASLRKRNKLFRGERPFPNIEDKIIILVDDGLASGYTMLAAIRFAKKLNPQKIVVAVPTGSFRTVEVILLEVDELVCLNIRGGQSFAVADAYTNWRDLTDKEVLAIMEKFNKLGAV